MSVHQAHGPARLSRRTRLRCDDSLVSAMAVSNDWLRSHEQQLSSCRALQVENHDENHDVLVLRVPNWFVALLLTVLVVAVTTLLFVVWRMKTWRARGAVSMVMQRDRIHQTEAVPTVAGPTEARMSDVPLCAVFCARTGQRYHIDRNCYGLRNAQGGLRELTPCACCVRRV